MVQRYLLPRPRLVDWLFGIQPEVLAIAPDESVGDETFVKIQYRGQTLGIIHSKFSPDNVEVNADVAD